MARRKQSSGILAAFGTSLTSKICFIGSAILFGALIAAGAYHVANEPANPAVWLVMYFWVTFALLLAYWMTYARHTSRERRGLRTGIMAASLLWSVLALGLTLVTPQIEGGFTWFVWGFVLVVAWGLFVGGLDVAYDGRIHRYLWNLRKMGRGA